MNIPSEVNIAGFNYGVKYLKDLNDGCNVLSGQIDFCKTEILLSDDENISKQCLFQTFLHEILHGIVKHYRVPIKENEEEEIVDRLADGLFQVLNGNNFLIVEDEKKHAIGATLLDMSEVGE